MKWWKWLLVVIGVGAVLWVAMMVVVLMVLPSPAKVRQVLETELAGRAKPAVSKTPEPGTLNGKETSASDAPAETVPMAPAAKEAESGLEARELMEKLGDRSGPLSSACAAMANPTRAAMKIKPAEFGKLLYRDLVRDEKDPAIESMLPTLRSLFRLSEFKDLMVVVEEAKGGQGEGLLDKADFYRRVYALFTRVLEEKPRLEAINNRTYHLFMMSRVMAKRPDLAHEPAVMDYCNQIEAGVNGDMAFGGDDERQAFLDFLSKVGVRAEEIGFDPKFRADMTPKNDRGGLQFNGGWESQWVDVGGK